jgi:thioredoxin reductase (NADPH)
MANYNELVKDRIFMGGAADLSEVLTEKEIDTVIDLRSKTEDTVEAKHIEKIHQPIFDETVNQEEAVQKAIDQVTKAYHEGKNVYFHCAAGQNRTGTVAVGSLLALNKAETIEEAKKQAKTIRPAIKLKPEMEASLKHLFSDQSS